MEEPQVKQRRKYLLKFQSINQQPVFNLPPILIVVLPSHESSDPQATPIEHDKPVNTFDNCLCRVKPKRVVSSRWNNSRL